MDIPLRYASLENEVHIERLDVKGEMPKWLNGMLLRNGPAKFEVGDKRLHWLDGLAMIHLFSFKTGNVSYTNKFLRSAYYESVATEEKLPYRTFASDPCKTLFKSFFSLFYSLKDLSLISQNTNVNITKIAEHFVALTEVPLSIEFDPKTLSTLGVFQYEDHLEKSLRFETAHPHYDFKKKEVINYYTKFGRKSSYNIFSIPDNSTQRKLIAKIPVDKPAYMHTFAMTENYLVLAEFPFVINPLSLFIKRRPFIENFKWQPKRGTRFIVIERARGIQMSQYFADSFFAFHHVNAFERDKGITLDIVTYKDPSIIWSDDMLLNVEKCVRRFELSFDQEEVYSYPLSEASLEMPRINSKYDGLPYQYLYGIGGACELLKMDATKGVVKGWQEEGCYAGEPVFVEKPEAKEEDDGIILSVILDEKSKHSFLLVLDAKDFSEIARASLPHHIPFGLHGQFYNGPFLLPNGMK